MKTNKILLGFIVLFLISASFASAAPVVGNITFTQTDYYIGQTLEVASWNFTSASGADRSYYKWYLNGVPNGDVERFDGTNYPTFSNFSALNNFTGPGDNYTLSILANNESDNASAWVNATPITIQDVTLTITADGASTLTNTMYKNETDTFSLVFTLDQNTTLNYTLTNDSNSSILSSMDYSNLSITLVNTTPVTVELNITSGNVVATDTFSILATRGLDGDVTTLSSSVDVVETPSGDTEAGISGIKFTVFAALGLIAVAIIALVGFMIVRGLSDGFDVVSMTVMVVGTIALGIVVMLGFIIISIVSNSLLL